MERAALVFEVIVQSIRMTGTLSIFLLSLVMLLAIAGHAQIPAPKQPIQNPPAVVPGAQPSGPTSPGAPDVNSDPNQERIAHEMAKKANKERQAAIKSDTEKLVKLTAELKAYVDKSNENVLSLEVLKKAEEIEKLARSVREKMKGSS